MNATRTTLSEVLWRWQRGIMRAMLLTCALAGMTLGAPAHAQIARVAQSSAVTGGGGATSVVVATPTGTMLNDVMLAVVTVRGAGQTINLPAGWTAVAGLSSSVGGDMNQRVFYRVAIAAEPATHAFSWTVSERGIAAIVAYRNVDLTVPIIDAAGAQTAAPSTNIVAPSISTTVVNTMLVGFFGDAYSGASITTPAGMTNIFGAGSEPSTGAGPNGVLTLIAEELRAPTGGTGSRTAVSTQNVANIGHILALRPRQNFNQSAYRMFNNANSTNVGTPLAALNTAATLGSTGSAFRLRVLLHVAGANLGISGQAFKLQFAARAGTCDTAFSGETYADVTAASVIAYNNNSIPADGASLSGNANDPTHGADTVLNQTYEELNNFTNPVPINAGQDGKWDFALRDNGAPAGTTYCFRVVRSTGSVLETYTVIPEITTSAGVPTPGSFNAFETSTGAGAITGVIRTKVAGSAFSLDVVAIASGAQQAGFTDVVIVELLGNNTLGVSLDAQNCPTSFTLVQTVSPNPTITGGRSTVNFAAVANSWRDVRVRVRWTAASPSVTWCSTDNFAIRPNTFAGFSITDTDWQTAGTLRTLDNTGATGGNVHKAGQPFTIRATAVNAAGTPATTTNYAGAPTATTSDCGASSACPATPGSVTLGSSFVAGVLTADTASYSEVGSFVLQLVDDTFASVDSADGSTPAERNISSATINVGRFVPDHFDLTSVTAPVFRTFNDAVCAARSFTYIGQRFGYATIPVAMIVAKNASAGTTTNYTGALWKLTNASASQTFANSPVMPLDTAAIAAPTVSETAGTGTGTLTANVSDAIAFVRDNASPQAPFNANLSLTISVTDATEAGAGQGTITTSAPLVFNGSGSGISFDSGNVFRYGRLVIRNANGSQLTPLPVLMEAQYWGYTNPPANTVLGFITNTADNCTSLAAANEAMGNYTGNLSGSPTCETAISGGGTLSGGRRTLQLAAPGSGNNGSVDLTVNLGAAASGNTCTTVGGAPASATTANLPYLQGNWTGGTYDQNPTARASFGLFKGAGEVIFVRENF